MDSVLRNGLLEPLVNPIDLIPGSGGCTVSISVLDGSPLKWAFRQKPVNPQDNGWRFLSATDTGNQGVSADSQRIRSFNTIANIEPLVLEIWGAPVGTDLQLVVGNDGSKTWYDNMTGQVADLDYFVK